MTLPTDPLPTLESWLAGNNLASNEISIPCYAPLGNTALAFDGVDDYVFVRPPSGDALARPIAVTGDYTIQVWARASSVTSNQYVQTTITPKVQTYASQQRTAILCQWNGTTSHFPFALWFNTADGTVSAARQGTTSIIVNSNVRIDDGYYHRILISRTTEGSASYLQLAVDFSYQAVADTAGVLPDTDPSLALLITMAQCNDAGADTPPTTVNSAFRGAATRVSLWNQGFSMKASGEFTWDGTGTEPALTGTPTAVTPASVAVGQWLCNEGYGNMVFDRAGRNHGRLASSSGGATGPRWIVSNVLDIPRNIT